MKTFYFNTGVRPYSLNPPAPIMKGEVLSPNGVKLIPFDCEDVPEGATFAFACSNPNLEEAKTHIVREMHNTAMISKYAYFKL